MKKRTLYRAGLAIAVTVIAFSAGPAGAGAPSPVDGTPSGQIDSSIPVLGLLTQLFAPGEVDPATLGVSDAELLTVGPNDDSVVASASSPKLVVDNPADGIQCPDAAYTMIQPAVTAAPAGATVEVCPGVYEEQVTILADGLRLVSKKKFEAVIKAPPAMAPPQAIVRVNAAQDARITRFTITGPSNGIRYGVFVDGGGSAEIDHNHITEIRDMVFGGSQNGLGVGVGRFLEPTGPTTGSAHVHHNLIDGYQKAGVLVDNGSSAHVDHNEITGAGPTPIIAQNGIQVSRNSTAQVDHNVVSRNNYTVAGTVADGILLFEQLTDTGTRIDHNKTYLNDNGIDLSASTFTQVDHNSSFENDSDGLRARSNSTDNTFDHNKAFDNVVLDCRDSSSGTGTAGTANTWTHNSGVTALPTGICKH